MMRIKMKGKAKEQLRLLLQDMKDHGIEMSKDRVVNLICSDWLARHNARRDICGKTDGFFPLLFMDSQIGSIDDAYDKWYTAHFYALSPKADLDKPCL